MHEVIVVGLLGSLQEVATQLQMLEEKFLPVLLGVLVKFSRLECIDLEHIAVLEHLLEVHGL